MTTNDTTPRHAFGYAVGDEVVVFTFPNAGYYRATAIRLTKTGRLVVRYRDGREDSFLPNGHRVGDGGLYHGRYIYTPAEVESKLVNVRGTIREKRTRAVSFALTKVGIVTNANDATDVAKALRKLADELENKSRRVEE